MNEAFELVRGDAAGNVPQNRLAEVRRESPDLNGVFHVLLGRPQG